MPDVRTVFTDRQLRCTRQRMDVYRALARTKLHPTAEELHRLVESTSPGTSLATVYNTLEALCAAGLARRIATTQGATRYDADVSDHVHAMRDDGVVMDVPSDLASELMAALPRDLSERLARRMGIDVNRITIELSASSLACDASRGPRI